MFYDKIWHSAIWGFSVKKAAFSCQTSRWWRSTQKWMEWGIWRHHYWHYYLAAHRIQQPIQNYELPNYEFSFFSDWGAPKTEWNLEFEDIVADTKYYYQIQEPIPYPEFLRIFYQKAHNPKKINKILSFTKRNNYFFLRLLPVWAAKVVLF